MATTTGVRLTKAGERLLAKLHTGQITKLELTSFVIGDGVWTPEEIDSLDHIKLKQERMKSPIIELSTGTGVDSGRLICTGVLNNLTVTSSFYVREIGIMANDPEAGEILYLIDPIPENAPTTVVESNAVRQDVPIRMELIATTRDKVELKLSDAVELVTPEQLTRSIGEIKALINKKTTDIDAKTLQGKKPADFAVWDHKHAKSDITDFPASLPANGGRADTSTRLLTPRKINGIEFDGTKDITIAIVPVGFIYIQYPGQSNPAVLYGIGTWNNISHLYSGRFFRAEGGKAAAFSNTNVYGSNQDQDICSHTHPYTSPLVGGFVGLSKDNSGTAVEYPTLDGAKTGSTGGIETRPINATIRIWKRVA